MLDWEKFKKQIHTQPRKTLRFVAGLSVTLVVLWLTVLVQSNTGTGRNFVDVNGLEEITTVERAEQAATGRVRSSDSDSFSAMSPALLLLFFGGGGIFVYHFFFRKSPAGRKQRIAARKLDLIEQVEMSGEQSISIVRVCGEYWIVGTGGKEIQILNRMSSDEWTLFDTHRETGIQDGNGFMNLFTSIRNGVPQTVNGSIRN